MGDLKDKAIEASWLGLLALIGGFFAKRIKPTWEKGIELYKIGDRVDDLEKRVIENEKEMKIAISRKKALMATDPNPLYITDQKGNLLMANPAWAEITGFYNIQDAYGKGWLRVIPEDERDMIEQLGEEQSESPHSFEGEVRLMHIKTKAITTTICRTELVKDEEGNIVEIIGRLLIIK